jgi:hypothetical protein
MRATSLSGQSLLFQMHAPGETCWQRRKLKLLHIYIYIYIYICAQSQSYIVRIYYYMETKSLFFFPKKKRVCTEDRPLKRTSRKLFPRKENKDRWWALPARSAHDGAQLEENIWRCSISYILLKQCLHAWHHHPSSCSLICSLVGSMHA